MRFYWMNYEFLINYFKMKQLIQMYGAKREWAEGIFPSIATVRSHRQVWSAARNFHAADVSTVILMNSFVLRETRVSFMCASSRVGMREITKWYHLYVAPCSSTQSRVANSSTKILINSLVLRETRISFVCGVLSNRSSWGNQLTFYSSLGIYHLLKII